MMHRTSPQEDRKSSLDDVSEPMSLHMKLKSAGFNVGPFLKHGQPAPPIGAGFNISGIATGLEAKREMKEIKAHTESAIMHGKDVGAVLATRPKDGTPFPTPKANALNVTLRRYRDYYFCKPVIDNVDFLRSMVSTGFEAFCGSRSTKPVHVDRLWQHGVNGYWTSWPGVNVDTNAPTILYLHCGLCVCGTALHSFGFYERLSRSFNMRVLSIDYRLCPEHSLRDALEDVIRSYKFLINECKVSPSSVLIVGDDGGALLGMMALNYITTAGLAQPAGMWASSPLCTIDEEDSSQFRMKVFERDTEYLLSEDAINGLEYVRRKDYTPKDPDVNPLYMNPANIKVPVLFTMPEGGVFTPEGIATVKRLKEGGVNITGRVVPNVCTAFIETDIPEAHEEIAAARFSLAPLLKQC